MLCTTTLMRQERMVYSSSWQNLVSDLQSFRLFMERRKGLPMRAFSSGLNPLLQAEAQVFGVLLLAFSSCRCWACRQASVPSWWSGEEAASPQAEVLVPPAETAPTSGLAAPSPAAWARPRPLTTPAVDECVRSSVVRALLSSLAASILLRSCCLCFHLRPLLPPFSPSFPSFSLLAPSFPSVFSSASICWLPCVRQLVIRRVEPRTDTKTPDSLEPTFTWTGSDNKQQAVNQVECSKVMRAVGKRNEKLKQGRWDQEGQWSETGTSLAVQWLRLQVPNAGGPGSSPGWGIRSHRPQWTKILCPSAKTWQGQINK